MIKIVNNKYMLKFFNINYNNNVLVFKTIKL
jgi:hypothetical protein